MDDVIEFLVELVPDAVTDFLGDALKDWIYARVENRVLRKVFYVTAILLLAVVAALVTCGILVLIGHTFS